MRPTVAIIGRPNVGKSTLFNRLAGKKLAIVADTPGVTRDRREADGRIADLGFRVVDTAGLDEALASEMEQGMRQQTERALVGADLVLFLIDARTGLTPIDRHFADWLRERPVPVVLVANKCEGNAGNTGFYEAYELGFGEPVALSAEHGEGLAELYQAVAAHLRPEDEDAAATTSDAGGEAGSDVVESDDPDGSDDEADDLAQPIQLAIVGRPNVGKSTLVNRLLGEDRVLTGPEPGVTRDSIAVEWQWDGRPIRLIDTAGMRRRARVFEKIEKMSVEDTLRAIRFAQVVVLVIDAAEGLDRQDLVIARMVADEGRALVIAINKWDLVEDAARTLAAVEDRLQTSLAQMKGIPVVTLSAVTGRRLDRLMQAVLDIYAVWNRRVPTGALNRWFGDMLEQHPPPLVDGRRLKLRYITQIKRRPPTFMLFTTRPADVPESYLRYLVNGLRDAFALRGVPIRMTMRKGRNPFAD
ncbi:MAG: ribosome biogenesis GTPase Der [Alphaproteobacteria bacterium]